MTRPTWTDERLDDHVDSRLFAIQKTMVQGFVVMMTAMITGFIALVGVILTQM